MAKKTSAKKRPSRDKKEMAANIRKRVMNAQQSLLNSSEEVESNQQMATAISAVAVSIEGLSEGMEKIFKDLVEELSKIPETVKEQEENSSNVLEKLIDAILNLEDQLKEETDPEKREKIQGQIGALKGEAGKAYDKTADAKVPRTMGQMAAKFLGVDAKELKDEGGGVKGFLKAFVGTGPDKGLRGDIPKFFGLGSKPSLDDKMAAARGSREIAGTLDNAKEEKENERKTAIAARLKDTPEHLRVKSDEQGRFRIGKKGVRLDEYNTNDEGERVLNPRFQPASGMMGAQLQDEGTGYTYEAGKGVQAGMVPGGRGSSVAVGGTDESTDEFKDDVLKHLREIDENFEDLEDATRESSGGLLGGLMKFLGPMAAGVAAIGPALLPLGVAIAGIWAAMKVFQAAKGFKEMREAQKGAKEAEGRASANESDFVESQRNEDPELVARAEELQKADPAGGDKQLSLYIGQARRERMAATGATPSASSAPTSASASGAPPGASSAAITPAPGAPPGASSAATPAPATAGFTGEQQERLQSYGLDIQEKENTRQELMSDLEQARRRSRNSSGQLENSGNTPAPQQTINNIDNSQRVNAPQAAAPSGGASVSIRDTHNSYMRFQERRMSRVM
jgi:hypothetical protein